MLSEKIIINDKKYIAGLISIATDGILKYLNVRYIKSSQHQQPQQMQVRHLWVH